MILAVLLFIGFASSPAAVAGNALQSATPNAPSNSGNQQADTPNAQSASSSQQPGSATSNSSAASSTSSQTPSAAKSNTKSAHHNHRQAVQKNCDTSASGATSGASQTGSTSAENSTASTGTPSTSCPPTKVVVRHGGTSEPSIQLAGTETGDQAAQQRETANQLLGSTEENLKKLTGQSLNANQQETVSQIHQFMEQSKTAVAAGDLDRARTLAWKAQVLSQELVNPKQ